VQPAIEPQDAKPRAVIEGGVLKGPPAAIFTNFTSTWTLSPGSAFSNTFICRGTRFGVRRRRARPISRKIRWIVPTATRTSWTRRNHSWVRCAPYARSRRA
jgi:hypothetical protein